MRYYLGLLAVVGLMGCNGGSVDGVDLRSGDSRNGRDTDVEGEIVLQPLDVPLDGPLDLASLELPRIDGGTDSVVPLCDAGEGCFLDPCEDNGDCLSGWCVEHLGEAVCSQNCVDECPAGWSCQMVAGTRPDAVFICVSDATNLCRPCNSAGDCKTGYGAEDVCVEYGAEGAFCGAPCGEEGVCPWGFSCLTTVTVDGIDTLQCVADAGVCPCTNKSSELALWTACEVSNEWGVCAGKRVCGTEGLTECDAMVPDDEVCNGLDDDCDGETDEAKQIDEGYENLCNDDNPCTVDSCNGEAGCDSAALTEGECADGDPCTVADHCEAGVCVGESVECDDDNPCTLDVCTATGGCEHPAQGGECDDGEACTLGDHCADGVCAGEAVSCDCQGNADCGALEDGNLCNGTLVCDTSKVPFVCVVDLATVVECPAAEGVNGPCLDAVCDPATGGCSFASAHDSALCDDGDACTVAEACLEGICGGGLAANCNDGNVCTDDSCNGESGCSHTDNEAACSDGLDCTVADACVAGTCNSGDVAACDDGNPCTDESCVEGLGCQYAVNSAECDDGNACTVGDHCAEGKCVVEGGADCDDDNVCTDDGCDSEAGCVYSFNELVCSDGNPCTVGEHCLEGVCIGGVAQNCDDGNLCTDDTCGADGLCSHTNNVADCDDGDACWVGEQCDGGECVAVAPLECADGNVCTTDTCDPASGCVFTLNAAPCDDEDLCTTTDACQLGECLGIGELNCEDGNPCTDDACDPEKGCLYVANADPCNDGNACTNVDFCDGGLCKGGAPLDCDDEDVCTDDDCDANSGCVHLFNSAPCDDGDECTVNAVCGTGVCAGGDAVECDDGNLCTDDSCLSESGCHYLANSDACDDDNACTVDDQCGGGECQGGGALTCDDDKDCTKNECDADAGCVYPLESNGTACGEGLAGECQAGICALPSVAYSNGNEAYWTERKLGFRDVTIGGGQTVYTYNESLKQYRSGDTILLPTKAGGANGSSVSANSFYGFQGGSASDSNFQWDSASKIAQPNAFDVANMFISPMLQDAMSYCKIMQFNNSSCGATVVDGPNDTLAYPNHSPKSGTFNVESGTDLIALPNLKGNGSTQYISQQQLGDGPNKSYCVATYGKGWRMATDVEMGHTTDEMNQTAEIGYMGNSSYRVRSSTAWPGLNDQRWCPYSNSGSFNQCNVGAAGSRRVRCVFPGT